MIGETAINSIRVYRREESFEDSSITSKRIYHNPIYEVPVKKSGGWQVVGGGYPVGKINGMRLRITRARCTLQDHPFHIYIYKFNKAERADAGKPDPAAS